MSNENMEYKYPIRCVCCGEGNISGLHDICPICGWEDDEVQNNDPTFGGGANKLSLEEYRVQFSNLRKKNRNYKWINNIKE